METCWKQNIGYPLSSIKVPPRQNICPWRQNLPTSKSPKSAPRPKNVKSCNGTEIRKDENNLISKQHEASVIAETQSIVNINVPWWPWLTVFIRSSPGSLTRSPGQGEKARLPGLEITMVKEYLSRTQCGVRRSPKTQPGDSQAPKQIKHVFGLRAACSRRFISWIVTIRCFVASHYLYLLFFGSFLHL